jgi:hypothetical protein
MERDMAPRALRRFKAMQITQTVFAELPGLRTSFPV